MPRIVLSYREGSTRFSSRQWTSFDRIRSPARPRPVLRAREGAGAIWKRPERSWGPGRSTRLIEAGVRFVTLSLGGEWDTHNGCFPTLREQLLPRLDQSISALLSDMASRGLFDRTIVYCVGEFGRTPKLNQSERPRSLASIDGGDTGRRGLPVRLCPRQDGPLGDGA